MKQDLTSIIVELIKLIDQFEYDHPRARSLGLSFHLHPSGCTIRDQNNNIVWSNCPEHANEDFYYQLSIDGDYNISSHE